MEPALLDTSVHQMCLSLPMGQNVRHHLPVALNAINGDEHSVPARREWIQYGGTSTGRYTNPLPSISTPPLWMRPELGWERGTVICVMATTLTLFPDSPFSLWWLERDMKFPISSQLRGTWQRAVYGGLQGVTTEGGAGVALSPKQSVPAFLTQPFHHDLSFFFPPRYFYSYVSSTILCMQKAHSLLFFCIPL